VLQFQSLGTLAATLALARSKLARALADAAIELQALGPEADAPAISEDAELELRLLLRLLQDWYSVWQ